MNNTNNIERDVRHDIDSLTAGTPAETPHSRASSSGALLFQRSKGDSPPSDGVKHFVQEWYQRIVIDLILRQKPLPPSRNGRRIPLNGDTPRPLVDERRGSAYISNAIRTSRYNVFNFFPKQLFFQFSRLGNFYFLCVGIPQTIPGLSTTGSVTTILPLLFFVLLTVLKEGYDDYKRHRLDNVENAQPVVVLRKAEGGAGKGAATKVGWLRSELWARFNRHRIKDSHAYEMDPQDEEVVDGFGWIKTAWSDIQVGDIIRLSRDDEIPADIILLHADGENGLAYIETMALDGETNLKSKQVLTAFQGCDTIKGITSCEAEFVVEDPNPDLYKFDGRVTINGETMPLTLNEVVYRGSIVRNTPSAIGIVINSGEECKIRLNANQHPSAKQPALEAVYNRVVLTLVFYVICLTAGCSVGYVLWHRRTEQYAWYLSGVTVPAEEIIVGFAIMFNNIIPLALYVSLEIIKIGQMLMLNSDLDMFDEATDTPARCNTNTILENLGQIGYVFSDKTGTLTENVMKFRKMTIAGTAWLHEMDIQQEQEEVERVASGSNEAKKNTTLKEKAISPVRTTETDLSIPTVVEPDSSSADVGRISTSGRRSSSQWRSTARPGLAQPDVSTTDDLLEFIRSRPNSAFARKATQYILAMALCHTCLPEVKDGRIEFQSSSPDELALVRAAQDLGYMVVQRSSQQITLKITNGDGPETLRVYKILDVIEFSSKRKRMSLILRCPDGRIWLISKGADSMILPRLKMAGVAIQKANEVRQSAEMERALHRKSMQMEPRNSFGGRPSLTIRRSIGGDPSGLRPPMPARSKSSDFESFYRAEDRSRPPRVRDGRMSLEVTPAPSPRARSTAGRYPDKFTFLEDPSVSDDAEIFARSFKLLDDFATEGLRTLLFAHKFIPEADYAGWKKIFHDAETSLLDRQERIEEAGDIIEQNLDLVGASAIEDKLQKGVPETIDKLRRANIKIWMLTGDKRETAINIAHSARICRPGSEIYILDATRSDLEAQMLEVVDDLCIYQGNPQAANHTVVVIDGHTLGAIENPTDSSASNPRLKQLLYKIIPHVDSVICCRASPAQKAFIVRATRKISTGYTAPLTLAIGDGANDLAMIAEAHVGVGISGREGLQAARVADYSIAQFSFLQRLLLVHGRWNYTRTAKFVLWTFWKEMFFYIPQQIFARYTGYTGTSLYESWSLTVLNILFTSLATIVAGIWEQDLAAETLLAVPELYVYGQRGEALNATNYLGWMIGAASEGVIVFFACWAGYGVFGQLGPGDNGIFALGDLVFTACIIWTNWKLLIIETHYKSAVVLGAFAVTIAGWWLWQAFLAAVYTQQPSPYAVRGGFFHTFGRDPVWWATLAVVLLFLFVLELGFKMTKRTLVVTGLWKWRWPWMWWSRARGPGSSKGGMDKNLEDWDLELWQEMEKNPEVRERMRRILEEERVGDGREALMTGDADVDDDDERPSVV